MRHQDFVKDEFTRQADAFAASPTIRDPDRIRRLVESVDPERGDRVLELATGPGYVALAFAARCREVAGIDLTAAPLEIAERMRRERGISNARFIQADVESRLPFADGEFDTAVCRLSFHHFENPGFVAREMTRVCRVGGKVAVEDIVASEHAERAAYHNRFELLRDTSHTRFLALTELLGALCGAGCDIVRVATEEIPNPVARWLATTQTPPDRFAQVLAMIERDLAEDLSGTNPRRVDGELLFTHRMATIVAR